MKMISEIFLSHQLNTLAEKLIEVVGAAPIDPLKTQTIIVPNGQIKQWLVLEIAKNKGVAMGLKVLEIEQLITSPIKSSDLFCLIYTELSKATDPDLLLYLDGKKKRLLDLADQLTSLFFSYGLYGKSLFELQGTPPLLSKDWQRTILHKLFIDGPWKLPVQIELKANEPLICFGVDYLPPIYWNFLFSAPSLSIFLFSPCVDFWEDVCTDRERKKLNQYWRKRGASKVQRDQLDLYLRDAPKNLANWGKIGRQTLKTLDQYDLQKDEAYPSLEPTSSLSRIQFDLLSFKETQKMDCDSSIQVILAGSSRLKEVEAIRDEVIRLNIPYHEITVLAPDISPYVPLIEFVFAESIPYRISGFDIAPQSSFRQGLVRLFRLGSGRWSSDEVLALFETPSFFKKMGWDDKKLQLYRDWINSVKIKWGLDQAHRSQILKQTLGEKEYSDHGSWEKGLDALLDALVYLKPTQIDADALEELIATLDALKTISITCEKTLFSWADCLEKMAQEFLIADLANEADLAALNSFRGTLLTLRTSQVEGQFPFSVIQKFLTAPCSGQIHSSLLHAVRFMPLEIGAQIPSKAVFLMDMNEENFPRMKIGSSLDLLKGQAPDQADLDRYSFLQAIFSAKEFLRISYCHLSADEGKPIGPSLVVQELLSTIDVKPNIYFPAVVESKQKALFWPKREAIILPVGEVTISVSELRQLARHPWKFYLQKVHGMYLNEPLEESFNLQKGQLLRAILQKNMKSVLDDHALPNGLIGEALKLEIMEKATQWQAQLQQWQLTPMTVILRENCEQGKWEGENYIVPPVELNWDQLKVRIVGEIKQATMKGLICANEDHLSGLLKVWPEALILGLCLDAPEVWMIRNGKQKQIADPEKSLKAFINYYFQCLVAPSPLLSEWADLILRKGPEDLEKKMQKGLNFDDPIVDWVLARAQLPSAEEMFQDWGPTLCETFEDLTQLYPTRGKSHAEV